MDRGRFDAITVVAIAFFVFLLANVVKDNLPGSPNISGTAVNVVLDTVQQGSKQAALTANLSDSQPDPQANTQTGSPASASSESTAVTPATYTDADGNTVFLPMENPNPDASAGGTPPIAGEPGSITFDPNSDSGDPNAWQDPYPDYIVTQGPHGMSYGHYAVDLTAGKGSDIHSPINGVVTGVFIDQYNNTNLVIENSRYKVLMLHGNYSAQVGQVVKIGDILGQEWNNGYTLDGNGNLCAGRDCGYHMHLNIFDKSINSNIDPFTLLKH